MFNSHICRNLQRLALRPYLSGGYGAGLLYAGTIDYLALVPAKSLPYIWNAFTASWLETSFGGLAVSCLAVIVLGKGRVAWAFGVRGLLGLGFCVGLGWALGLAGWHVVDLPVPNG